MTESKLNLGAGGQIVQGWTNLDRAWPDDLVTYTDPVRNQVAFDTDAVLVTHDLADLPLPFPDAAFRAVAAHHVLDMFPLDQLTKLCAELARVLEPGGVLRVSSPDFDHAIQALVRGDLEWFLDLGVPHPANSAVPHAEVVQRAFMWYLDWGGARKAPLVNAAYLAVHCLEPAGFGWEMVDYHETIAAMPTITQLDSREDESWFLEAVKL